MSDRHAAFTATALPYLRQVYGAAYRMCGNRDVADDVTQETFLRAYRTFEGFAAGTNCKAWLLTIMRSVVINRGRHEQRHPQTPLDDLPAETPLLAQVDPGLTAFIEQAPSPAVDAALQSLPDVFREAVILVDIEELTYEEAAQALQCPVGTVRSRLARARRLLFDALQAYAKQAGYPVSPERRA